MMLLYDLHMFFDAKLKKSRGVCLLVRNTNILVIPRYSNGPAIYMLPELPKLSISVFKVLCKEWSVRIGIQKGLYEETQVCYVVVIRHKDLHDLIKGKYC